MELHSAHKIFHPTHLGDEKQQMLNLNQRLETYLSRVKVLEEENALLAKEIQVMRYNNQGALTRRKGLEEELRQARLEVDAVWRDRVFTELEVSKLTEELRDLHLQRQREAQAQMKAKTKMEQSRKELEEEQRAQIWLKEKVRQLEQEMQLLIQTHQEDVVHLEAALTHSSATMPHTLAQRDNQAANLRQLEHEYSQKATRAWQEAAEAYQGQLDQLEESLNQARSRLTHVSQEKWESQLKLQALEKEITSAQDVRLHLEKTAAQQRERHSQDIQQLQEHLQDLEVEKEELGQEIDHLLLENQGLLQLKMSLGLEVATYRALLDSESFRGDGSLLNQPRHVSITDAVFHSQGVKKNYQTQLPARLKTTSLSSVYGLTGKTVVTATPGWSRKPVTLTDTQKISRKPTEVDAKSATLDISYPKILCDGAVESFRPQEVNEKVTYAAPLSPTNEQEASGDKEGEGGCINADVEPPEEQTVVESVISYQVKSGLRSEPSFHDRMTGRDESDKDETYDGEAEKQDVLQLPALVDTYVIDECISKETDQEQGESSDSETEAVLKKTSESRPSSPESECEPEESAINQETGYHLDAAVRQGKSCPVAGTHDTDVEEMLYPDGEEMDTWDSVIEKKVDLKTDEGIENDDEKRQHAEPEDDISAKEPDYVKREISLDVVRDDDVVSTLMITQEDDRARSPIDQENAPQSDKDEDDEEDSQNVSVSWRTELEGDSYAQDNTLADTRPLIRYKSDETDGNTHASHIDESESSEGEQEKKVGETEALSEGKSKRFGTMEDLCEDVEEETVDEDIDLGYTHIKERDVGQGAIANEITESEEEMDKVSEGHSDEEVEELAKRVVSTNEGYDEELDTDRLVEQELENLSTDSYSAHFAQQQVSDEVDQKYVGEMTEQVEQIEIAKPEDMSPCEAGENQESPTTVIEQTSEKLVFIDSSLATPETDTMAEEDIERKDEEDVETTQKREEEDEHNVSLVTHADVTEDLYGVSDCISRSYMEEDNNSEDINSVSLTKAGQENLQDEADPTKEIEDETSTETSNEPQEHLVVDVADSQELPEAPETTEWEVLENPREDFETRDQNEHDQKCDNVSKSAHEDMMTRQEESLEISPDTTHAEKEIYFVKDSTDNALHGFFSSGVTNDFWGSSWESGATNQIDDACNEVAEQANQNLGFTEKLVWGNLEHPNVVNGKSRVHTDSSEAPAAEKEQEEMHMEVKHVLCRKVVEGEYVHSEESEAEGELWSSGEEQA
ncbi:nestin [Mugil cephalus]|uniref:nestin n=1 Tax=Mugil cephalus TaxID=48193 RepID=UPI001FB5F4D7|nr:nestin [Mugil cephalus]